MSQQETNQLQQLIQNYENGSYDSAIELGKRFTKEFAHNGTGWNVLALSYKASGNAHEAIKIFKFLIKAIPKSPIYQANLGNSYLLIGRVKDAVACFKRALKLDPKMVNAIEALGLAYLESGKDKEAAKCFERAIRLDPKNHRSRYYLGNLYLNDRNWEAAKNILKSGSFGLSQSHYLECLLCLDEQKEFLNFYDTLKRRGVVNPLVGGIVAHAEMVFEQRFDNNFCNDALNHIHLGRLEVADGFTDDMAEQLIKYHHSSKNDYRSQPLLHNGSQSSGNLFLLKDPFISSLRECIEIRIGQYRSLFKDSSEGFLKNWPAKYDLFGWLVSIKEGGNLDAHNHKEGWLSGSFYLNLPKTGTESSDEGNIAFGYAGPRYPAIEPAPIKKIIDVKTRDICMFPSSLFHETIPFSAPTERVSFAFDVIPKP